MNRALEAVEYMLLTRADHLEGEMVLVATDFALGHASLLCRDNRQEAATLSHLRI
jgi:hypothetical protein